MCKEKKHHILVIGSPLPFTGGGLRALRSLREYIKYFKVYFFITGFSYKALPELINLLKLLKSMNVGLSGFSQMPEMIFKPRKILGTRIVESILPLMMPNLAHIRINTLNYNAIIVLNEGWDYVSNGAILAEFLKIPSMVILQLPPFYSSRRRFSNILRAILLWRALRSNTPIEKILSEIEAIILNTSEYYLRRLRYEEVFRKFNIILGVSKAVAVEMGDEWFNRVICLDPGVSLDDEDLMIIKRVKEKVRGKENYIVFGGRPTSEKGLFEALISFKTISKHFPDIKLLITGKALPTVFPHIRRICKKLGIESKVVFTGFIPRERRFEIVAKAKLMLYPSHVDAFPYAVLESLHLGTPVIAYRIPALEIYYGGTPGVELVNEWDLESFTVKAIDILEKGVGVIEPPKIKSWDEIMNEEVRIVQKLVITGKSI